MTNRDAATKDPYRKKQQSSPFSTGGGGINFENKVQASFLVLMLTRSFSPCLPTWPVISLQLQARHKNYNIDDFIVNVQDAGKGRKAKLLCQVKHDISIRSSDTSFAEVVAAAWRDFNDAHLFDTGDDRIALVTGPLSSTDLEVRELLDWARNQGCVDFFNNVKLAKFSSDNKRQKLEVIREHVRQVNGDSEVSDLEFWNFLKIFHLLQYDLDFKNGVHVSLLHSLMSQYDSIRSADIWARLIVEVQERNQAAGEITKDDIAEDIVEAFKPIEVKHIPQDFKVQPESSSWMTPDNVSAYSQALLIGAWDERNNDDQAAIESISGIPYSDWIKRIRCIHGLDKNRIAFKGHIWKIQSRLEQFKEFYHQFYDEQIEHLVRVALNVLSEIDPRFELNK
ncbi:MAG: hypothetical protein MI976_12345, partial [Pseudomonadales bacterium]|nr:hypothetical protein [Pseudomonadales bacterium]